MPFCLELLRRIRLAPLVFELVFTRPEGLGFQPGQHIRFHHQGLERDYTPVSTDMDDTIHLCVGQGKEPGLSRVLSACDPGTVFEASGPHGHFIFRPPPKSRPPVVFIGTGTGIAPFVAFARAGAGGDLLLQGARTRDDLIYSEIVRKNSRVYVPCLSHWEGDASETLFRGRVTDYLEQRLPRGEYRFYLCGRRQMILDTMDIIDEKFPDSRVFSERFS